MNRLYNLVDHGISITKIDKLVSLGASDLLLKREKINILGRFKILKRNDLKIINSLTKEDIHKINSYISFNSLRLLGLSNRVIMLYKIHFQNLDKLLKTNHNELAKMSNFMNKKKNDFLEHIDRSKELFRERKYLHDLYYFIRRHCNTYGFIKLLPIHDYGRSLNLVKEEIQKILDILYENLLIKKTSLGISLKSISLNDYKYLTVNPEIFYDRVFVGLTLEEIGTKNGITRERVRQIVDKDFKLFKNIKEDRYNKVFQKYKIDKEFFINFFQEKVSTYNYLKIRYKLGQDDIFKLIKFTKLTEKQKEFLSKNISFLYIDDVFVRKNKTELVKYFIRTRLDNSLKFNTKEIFEKLEKFYTPLGFEFDISESSLENILTHINVVISSKNHCVRRYIHDEMDINAYNHLIEIMTEQNGFFSTKYFFENHPDLMFDLNIKDQYELHNLIKRNKVVKDFKLLRSPNLLIDCSNKQNFFKDIFETVGTISMNDLVTYLEDNYGHNQGTMWSYLVLEYSGYISNDILHYNQEEVESEILDKLKTILIKDLYQLSNFKKENDINLEDVVLKRHLQELNYRVYYNKYILKQNYISVTNYITSQIEGMDFVHKDFLDEMIEVAPSALNSVLRTYRTDYKLIKFSQNEYITYKKLHEIQIDIDIIKNFVNEITSNYSDLDFFTQELLMDDETYKSFSNFGLDCIFIDDILYLSKKIKTISIDGILIHSCSANDFNKISFLESIIIKNGSMYDYEITNYLLNSFNIDVSIQTIKGIARNHLYYDETIKKIYLNRKQYMEEIYE